MSEPFTQYLVCIEGPWDDEPSLSRLRSQDFFEPLERLSLEVGPEGNELVVSHHRANRKEELEFLLQDLRARLEPEDPADYELYLWVGAHGESGQLEFHGAKGPVDVPAKRIARWIGDEVNLVHLHLSSCSVLAGRKGSAFVDTVFEETNANLVSGYVKDADWADSLLFELLVYNSVLWLGEPGDRRQPRQFDVANPRGKGKSTEMRRALAREFGGFGRRLGAQFSLRLTGGGHDTWTFDKP